MLCATSSLSHFCKALEDTCGVVWRGALVVPPQRLVGSDTLMMVTMEWEVTRQYLPPLPGTGHLFLWGSLITLRFEQSLRVQTTLLCKARIAFGR